MASLFIKIAGKVGILLMEYYVDLILCFEQAIIQTEVLGIVRAVLIVAIDTFKRIVTNCCNM